MSRKLQEIGNKVPVERLNCPESRTTLRRMTGTSASTLARPHLPARFPRAAARCAIAALATLALDGCLLGGSEPLAPVSQAPGTAQHGVQVGALTRTFLLHVPPKRPRRLGRHVAYPLVIVLHGSGANAETVRRMSGMDAIADAERFLVAYPNGTTGRLGLQSDWNAGECCGTAESQNVDDVAFIRQLVDSLASRMPVDRDRVFVAGFSDGGRMTYRIACELGAQIAAVAVISGSLVDAHCDPRRPVPLIAFHGTSDQDVAYADSSYSTPRRSPPSAADSAPPAIRFWSASNGCQTVTLKRQSPHVTQMHFDQCAAEVVLYTVEEGLHAWPGGASDGQEPTSEIDASSLAWRFFARHPLH